MENSFEEFIKLLSDNTLFQNEFVQWEFLDEIDSKFYSWFFSNCKCFNEIAPPPNNIQYKAIESSCFNNSQNISLKNEDIKYYEGIMRGAKFQSNTHHGFNVIGNKIFDITYIKYSKNFDSLRACLNFIQ